MRNRIFMVAAVAGFLLLLVYLPLSSAEKFNTPDETANFYFSELFARTGALKSPEPLLAPTDNVLHPRSINVSGGFLVPEGFWGLPLWYGTLALFLGISAIPFLTAASVLAALPFAYLLFREFFGVRAARLGVLLLAVNPVVWYNASRGLYPNTLFACLLIMALAMFFLARGLRGPRSVACFILAGIFAGMALVARPAEALWTGSLFASLTLYQIIGRKKAVAWSALAVVLPLLIVPIVNKNLYGNPWRFGYAVNEKPVTSAEQTDRAAPPKFSQIDLVGQIFLPFGFHPALAASRLGDYGIAPVWWLALPSAAGFLLALFRPRDGRSRAYALGWLAAGAYLVISYGAFHAEFFIDPGQDPITGIGSTYLRYWLPIFFFASPLAAEGMIFLRDRLRFAPWGAAATASAVLLLTALSARAVFWNGSESLSAIARDTFVFRRQAELMEAATPREAVFVAPKWADRIYFPERRVAVDLEGKNVVKIIQTLLKRGVPVFHVRGRGEVPLSESDLVAGGLVPVRRFDADPRGKIYEIRPAF